ncbi:CelD/BcsL family acetyltransferase involved in cellulose biosynthesis [Kibdelosporangium banguiense]|uniref:CelD/BcsL family acetyltransferase involved in cellulose biosynthesis n=1 Tax=Kibdelosporangium banguiense TaxID=1365924 RepID=A0ABS4TCX0_9PSEU|nr:GNAT family N-acetyltransferase [Kibdelosporangium banguiense]MBP2322255.1 CelD/BcsL family acetyltransferase involved in cellulose biosynthesis [Kibdelosporangium banguiense]
MSGFRLVSFDSLTEADLAHWQEIRTGESRWDSPYFSASYVAAVHAGRPVSVLLGDGFVWPLHISGSSARPAGSPGADFQGPVLAPGVRFSPRALLRAAGVKSLTFDHLVDEYVDLEPWIEERRPSPFMDVTDGLEGYLGRAAKSGRDKMSEARRLTNKAGRDLGTVEFVAASTEHLDQVIALKREQYASTGARDHFADPVQRELLHRLLDSGLGLLSTVHAGPHLLAAHFGIRSGDVLHWWFPAFDRKFGPLSPGWILLREVVMAAPELGITRIDLGRGEDDYKRRAMTGSSTVCIGAITSGARTTLRRVSRKAISAAKASPIAPQLKAIVRKFR